MAIIKFGTRKGGGGSCSAIKDYLEQDKKDKSKTRVAMQSTMNIGVEDSWDQEMQHIKDYFGKENGRQYIHIVQAFENEPDKKNYNIESVHKAGQKLAEKFGLNGFQAAIVTHADTENLHSHIIINTVNIYDGHKIQISFKDIQDIHKLNDKICKEYGLRTLSESKLDKIEKELEEGVQPENVNKDEIYIDKRMSFTQKMKDSLQRIWKRTDIFNRDQYEAALKEEGLSMSIRGESKGKPLAPGKPKTITYTDSSQHKARAKKLGAFTYDDIEKLWDRNKMILEKAASEKKVKLEKDHEKLVAQNTEFVPESQNSRPLNHELPEKIEVMQETKKKVTITPQIPAETLKKIPNEVKASVKKKEISTLLKEFKSKRYTKQKTGIGMEH